MIPKVKDVNYYMKDLKAHNQKILSRIVDTSEPKMPTHVNIIGKRYGRLVVIERIGKDKYRNQFYKCKCDCGNEIYVSYPSLCGGTKSCGCLHKEVMQNMLITHGYTNTRLYHEWNSMRQRCNNPKVKSYAGYGARGIKVCEEWNDPVVFIEWALANGYDDTLTIDRIDVDGDYCPENCRWADKKLQANNTKQNTYIRLYKWVFTLAIWGEITGIDPDVLSNRHRRGWTPSQLLCTLPGEDKYNCRCEIYVPPEYEIYNKYDEWVRKGLIDPNDDKIQ